jgi:hypothetical protein
LFSIASVEVFSFRLVEFLRIHIMLSSGRIAGILAASWSLMAMDEGAAIWVLRQPGPEGYNELDDPNTDWIYRITPILTRIAVLYMRQHRIQSNSRHKVASVDWR